MSQRNRKRARRAHPKSRNAFRAPAQAATGTDATATSPEATPSPPRVNTTRRRTGPTQNRRNSAARGPAKTRQRWYYDVRQYAIITDDDGRILLLQLPADYDSGTANTWTLPGGKLEPSDDPSSGISREITEETKLTPGPLSTAAVARWSTRNSKKLAIFYRARINGTAPKPTLSNEHQRAVWALPSELNDFPFHRPEMLETIKSLLS